MTMTRLSLSELTVEDETSFRHVELYAQLKAVMRQRGACFGLLEGAAAQPSDARLLNLAFWQPGDVAEVLGEPVLAADQVMHNAWHQLAADALGVAGRSAEGLLLAESIASAFDIYLVGRLLGHAPQSLFLQTQVPAMRDAAEDALMSDEDFEALLGRASVQPEQCFESLRALLFEVSCKLLSAHGLEPAHAILQSHASHPLWPLLHHYELTTWVLYARCYGEDHPADEVRAIDQALRASDDSLDWLTEHWLSEP